MKTKFIQKLMAGALTAALAAAPCMGVFASETPGGSGTPVVDTPSVEEEVVAIVNEPVSNDDEGGSAVSSIAQIPESSSVEGVTTSVKGVYLATSVNGAAVTTSVANIASSYNLGTGETPCARVYNMDVKKSPLAAAAIDNAAEALGATVGPYINVELGFVKGGKFGLLPSDGAQITMSFGIPKSFIQAGKTYAVICVRPGGAVTILPNISTNPNVITFATTGGQGAYAIIKY
ncbi:MAG: hypothetical protein NC341_09945 [Blautia sp.]|nr:hypothetical protein [Blautia sp.]MCM1201819.1 hypothetical protein [Bacteroides fragilis]